MITDIIATFATVAAVFVALWQTKISNKKSISISATNIFTMKQYNNGEISDTAEKGILIRVINTGNRRIIIKDIGVYIDRNFSLQISNIISNEFPKAIDVEEYFDFTIAFSSLYRALNSNLTSIKKPSSKICFYVTDSTGKKYLCQYCYSFDTVLKTSSKEFNVSLIERKNTRRKHHEKT